MRLTRIYFPDSLAENRSIQLAGESVHYLRNVLRLQPRQELLLFNSRDGEFRGTIQTAARNEVVILVQERQRTPQLPGLQLSLGLALSKGERLDFGIQKSTELGVSAITPLRCEYSEAKIKAERLENRMAHWQRQCVSATEQCGRLDPPQLNAPCAFDQWVSRPEPGTRLLFDPAGEDALPSSLSENQVRLAVGPEGGFSASELEIARKNNFLVCRLGPRVLRTETAPVVALAVLQQLYGDFARS